MRFVALYYDVIRSDAMIPIVEAIVLIRRNYLAAKNFSTINPIVKIDIKTSAAKIQKWIGVRFERGLSASRRISQLGSPLGGVRPI